MSKRRGKNVGRAVATANEPLPTASLSGADLNLMTHLAHTTTLNETTMQKALRTNWYKLRGLWLRLFPEKTRFELDDLFGVMFDRFGIDRLTAEEMPLGEVIGLLDSIPNGDECTTTHFPSEDARRAYVPTADLAKMFGVPQEALRKALERWRRNDARPESWHENTERGPNHPRYMYRISDVTPIIEKMISSGARPAKKFSPGKNGDI